MKKSKQRFWNRIDKDTILYSQKRIIIYTYIKNNPGKSMTEISNKLGYQIGTAEYHIRQLKKYNLIKFERKGRQYCFYTINKESQ